MNRSDTMLNWINEFTKIRTDVFSLLDGMHFSKEVVDGNTITTLDPTVKEQIEINRITEKYSQLTNEILRVLDKYPKQKTKFARIERHCDSYLNFQRSGGDLTEVAWKKIFVREFSQIISSLTTFIEEFIESMDNNFKYKCFRTAEDCSLSINYNKKNIFVIMPFSKDFNDIYTMGIKEPMQSLGFQCFRADEILHTRDIMCVGVCKPIQEAAYIIADLTTKNANVFFELGLAYGFEKEVLLLARTTDDIPFDLRGMNSIIYEGSISTLRNLLIKKFKI